MNWELANLAVAGVALVVSTIALGVSIYFWRRQFRPIVTIAVRTHKAGPEAIAYDLVVMNSGSMPAKSIQLTVDESSLASAFGADATPDNKETMARVLQRRLRYYRLAKRRPHFVLVWQYGRRQQGLLETPGDHLSNSRL